MYQEFKDSLLKTTKEYCNHCPGSSDDGQMIQIGGHWYHQSCARKIGQAVQETPTRYMINHLLEDESVGQKKAIDLQEQVTPFPPKGNNNLLSSDLRDGVKIPNIFGLHKPIQKQIDGLKAAEHFGLISKLETRKKLYCRTCKRQWDEENLKCPTCGGELD